MIRLDNATDIVFENVSRVEWSHTAEPALANHLVVRVRGDVRLRGIEANDFALTELPNPTTCCCAEPGAWTVPVPPIGVLRLTARVISTPHRGVLKAASYRGVLPDGTEEPKQSRNTPPQVNLMQKGRRS